MLFNYKEVIKMLGTDYKLKMAISGKILYKIEKGIYSDKRKNFTLPELLLKKYSNAFLVKESALHYIGYIEKEPEKVHLGTPRNALRINDDRVVVVELTEEGRKMKDKITCVPCEIKGKLNLSEEQANELKRALDDLLKVLR